MAKIIFKNPIIRIGFLKIRKNVKKKRKCFRNFLEKQCKRYKKRKNLFKND